MWLKSVVRNIALESSTVALTNHMKHVHQKIKYFCTECDYQGNRKLDIKLHRESKHEFIMYECTECEKHFTRQSMLKRHYESIHEGKKKYGCDQCDFKTAHRSKLNQHVKTIHVGEKTINVINVILKRLINIISTTILISYMKELDSLAMSVTRNSLPLVVFVNTKEMFIEKKK